MLNDYIEMRRLWNDDTLSLLEVICASEIITMKTEVYVTDALIDELVHQIKQFLNKQIMESCWSNGRKGNGSTACLSLHFFHKDTLGHILIEVFAELDDGGDYNRHNCCFYINTEMGLLERFCIRLQQLKHSTSDMKIVLNEKM